MRYFAGVLALFLLAGNWVFAEEFTSTDFKILDPVLNAGGYFTSMDFILRGSISEISIGTSTAASFGINAGFLFYPEASVPTLTASAGTSQVTLTWTSSSGFLGWTVSGYNIGRSTASGGPYTYTSVGNVLTAIVTELTNGTTYYFIVRPEDFYSNSIATSSEVSATPAGAGGGGGGGDPGGGGPIIPYVPGVPGAPLIPADCSTPYVSDLNCDEQVDLKDLSIFLFLQPEPIVQNRADFNRDAEVDALDLSVMFFDWTDRYFAFLKSTDTAPRGEQALEIPKEDNLAYIGKSENFNLSGGPLIERTKEITETIGQKIVRVFVAGFGIIKNAIVGAVNWLGGFWR